MTDTPSILDGQEGGFWDVAFTDDQAEAAQVETDMRTVLVCIEDDGEVTLSEGYEKRSPEGRDERSLFRVHRAAIEAALADDHRVRSMHPAFMAARRKAA
jgi:hypothetical protein